MVFAIHFMCYMACFLALVSKSDLHNYPTLSKERPGSLTSTQGTKEKKENDFAKDYYEEYAKKNHEISTPAEASSNHLFSTETGLTANISASYIQPSYTNSTLHVEHDSNYSGAAADFGSSRDRARETIFHERLQQSLHGTRETSCKHSNFEAVVPGSDSKGYIDSYITHPCSTYVTDGHNIVDCTGLSLTTIDSSLFPTNTNVIRLDNNNLETISDCVFSHLRDLQSLSVSRNKIRIIGVNAFTGLENLQSLNLEANKLTFSHSSYPAGVFNTLTSLRELRIQNNVLDSLDKQCYPDHFLGKLTTLEYLTIDTSGETLCFGKEFVNLTSLSRMEITGSSRNIDENSFENVKHISELYLNEFPYVSNFSKESLQPLQQLNVLHLMRVRAGVGKSLRALKPLKGKNMTTIHFEQIHLFAHDSYSSFIKNDGVLDYRKTQYLLEICVENFSLKGSGIYILQENAFKSSVWDQCLRHFDMSWNPLIGTKSAVFRLFQFRNIEMINLEGMRANCFSNNPSTATSYFEMSSSTKVRNIAEEKPLTLTNGKRNNGNLKAVISFDENITHNINNSKNSLSTSVKEELNDECPSEIKSGFYRFKISESLKIVQLRSSISATALNVNVKFIGAKSLNFLDFSIGRLQDFQGVISGWDALQTFVVSGNNVSSLSEMFFDSFCRLENLYLSNCLLDIDFMSRKSGRVFQNLFWLKRLDISLNLLNSLASDTFMSNKNLEELNLSKNRFKTIPFNLKYTPSLKVLDIRQNSITSLGPTERYDLDDLASHPDGFRLLLSGNTLSCDCSNFPFLLWLRTTHVQLDEGVNITCSDGLSGNAYLSANPELEGFWRKCWGEFFLSLAISLLFSMIIGFLVLFFVWKNQMFIKSTLMNFFAGYKLKGPTDYQTGAFIGYSEREYVFPCFDLRNFIENDVNLSTYVYHRDMSSPDMAWSIVDAINSSWRVVLLFTSSFLFNDEWSVFTYRSAIYSQTLENPSRVVVLVESRLQHKLPPEVLSAVHEDNIIVVSGWEMTYELREKLRNRLNATLKI